jgi:hypothetical protein
MALMYLPMALHVYWHTQIQENSSKFMDMREEQEACIVP